MTECLPGHQHLMRHLLTARDRRLGVRLLVAVVAAAVVAVPATLLLFLLESEWEPLRRLDLAVADAFHAISRGRPWLVDVFEVVAIVTHPWLMRAGIAVLVIVLWRRGARRLATWAGVTMAAGGLLTGAVKILVERARPTFEHPVASTGGFSFPSGHALSSMLAVTIVLLVVLPLLDPRRRALAWALGAVVVLTTALDRIILGVHYVSDVVAGWSIALAVAIATTTAFETWRRDEGRRPSAPVQEGLPGPH